LDHELDALISVLKHNLLVMDHPIDEILIDDFCEEEVLREHENLL